MTRSSTASSAFSAASEPLAFEALPAELQAGKPQDVWFSVLAAHPSNQLLIYRVSDGRERSPLQGSPCGRDPVTGAQRFRAQIPPLKVDETIEYRPVLQRSGMVIKEFPARSSKGVSPAGVPIVPDRLSTTGVPRYQWATEFLGAFTVQLAKPPESFGPAPDGLHITFYIASGGICGPKINAQIRGEGGDWMLIRRDGVGVADVRITYETDDGALLLSRYYGIFDLGPRGYDRALRNEYDPVPPLVLAPQFVTSHPNWLWLNRLQCIGVGSVTMAELRVHFDLYAIRAGQPLPGSGLPPSRRTPLVGDIH